MLEGESVTNMTTIRHHITDFYRKMLGIPELTCAHIEPHFWNDLDKLTGIEQQSLEHSFTIEELKKCSYCM